MCRINKTCVADMKACWTRGAFVGYHDICCSSEGCIGKFQFPHVGDKYLPCMDAVTYGNGSSKYSKGLCADWL